MLSRNEINQRELISLVHRWQRTVFITFTQRRHDFCPAVETQDTTARFETEVARTDGQRRGVILRRRHLTGDKLTPDQLIQFLGVGFHIFQRLG